MRASLLVNGDQLCTWRSLGGGVASGLARLPGDRFGAVGIALDEAPCADAAGGLAGGDLAVVPRG